MNIMPCRYEELSRTIAGYEKTGIELLAFDGNTLRATGITDDYGIYYWIPKISRIFNLNLSHSIDLFFAGILLLSLLISISVVCLSFRNLFAKLIGIIVLIVLSCYAFWIGDVYVLNSAVPISIVPCLLLLDSKEKIGLPFYIFSFFSGACISLAHYIRIHSGTSTLIFFMIVILLSKFSRLKKTFLAVSLAVGMLIVFVFFNHLFNERDNYLKKHFSSYQPPRNQHPIWHSIYVGLGYLPNPYGIIYRDERAIDKVKSIAPNAEYLSEEYEEILKSEVLRIAQTNPQFVIKLFCYKVLKIIFYFLIFSNIGLVLAFIYPQSLSINAAFFAALSFSALPGILVIPMHAYLLGFIAFAALYGLMNFCLYFDRAKRIRSERNH